MNTNARTKVIIVTYILGFLSACMWFQHMTIDSEMALVLIFLGFMFGVGLLFKEK